jgi:hypothetical protein
MTVFPSGVPAGRVSCAGPACLGRVPFSLAIPNAGGCHRADKLAVRLLTLATRAPAGS